MNYLTCARQGTVDIVAADIPQPGPGEIIVQLAMCGVCGTDTMKVFSDYPKPQRLGHEVVGRVHACGVGVKQFAVADRVALAHHVQDFDSHYTTRGSATMDPAFKRSNIDPGGFSEFIRLPASHVLHTVMSIPDSVPDRRAVFMEPLACCLRAVDRVPLQPRDSVMIVGVGAVGMLFVPLLRQMGIDVLAVDTRADRIELAGKWGANLTDAKGNGRGVDCVILTVVTQATMLDALSTVRDGGTIVVFGGKPGGTCDMPMWEIWVREINVVTSYSATPDGLRRAMQLLAGPAFHGIESLVSHEFKLAEAQVGFELVQSGKSSKVVITP